MPTDLNFTLMIPEFVVLGSAVLVLLLDAVLHGGGPRPGDEDPRDTTLALSVIGCVVAAAWIPAVLWDVEGPRSAFNGLFVADRFALFFKGVVLVGAVLSLLLSDSWLRRRRLSSGAAHALLLFATSGMMYMVSAGDMVTLFLGLEVMSIPIYCLAALLRWEDRSVEAGVKYLVLGAFATAIMLFGFALLYGYQGMAGDLVTTRLGPLQSTLMANADALPIYARAGGLLVLIGLLFKISAAPFHMWTPDVYEGAPLPFVAFMSVAVKATAAAVLIRVFGGPLLVVLGLDGMLWAVAAFTMIVGNFMALVQDNVKRMLAYSSIAHGGYILVGVLAGSAEAQAGVLYYALAYTVGNIAAFAVLIYLSREGHEAERFADLEGLGARYPLVGGVMVLAMLSLTGIPPLVGFFGKFVIFKAAVAEGFVLLTVLALLTSAVSFAYYLRPIIALFMRAETTREPVLVAPNRRLAICMAITALAICGLGVFSESYLGWLSAAVLALAG